MFTTSLKCSSKSSTITPSIRRKTVVGASPKCLRKTLKRIFLRELNGRKTKYWITLRMDALWSLQYLLFIATSSSQFNSKYGTKSLWLHNLDKPLCRPTDSHPNSSVFVHEIRACSLCWNPVWIPPSSSSKAAQKRNQASGKWSRPRPWSPRVQPAHRSPEVWNIHGYNPVFICPNSEVFWGFSSSFSLFSYMWMNC